MELDEDDMPVPLKSRPSRDRLKWYVRTLLVVLAVGWLGVFAIAFWLNPYVHGRARTMETHLQLGLEPCTFKTLCNLPCPSCGMTTSFSLFVRGDLWSSLRANFAGTLLAAFGVLFVVWGFLTAWKARILWIRDLESLAFKLAVGFIAIMFLRWGVVVWIEFMG